MNYSDFPDIQQDEWSLTRPTFPTPKGGTLTVEGWSGKRGTVKLYIVVCSECKKDNKLFGEGVFSRTKHEIKRGVIPCGCSNSPRWSRSQYFEILSRASEQKGHTFLGFLNDQQKIVARKTKIRVSCQKHGEWSTTVRSAVSNGVGCPSCGFSASHRRREDVPEDVLQVMPDCYEILFVDGRDIKVRCKICEMDKYSKNNLCTGEFKTTTHRLRRGILPCRCSKGLYTPSQLIFRAEECCRSIGYTFVEWIKEPKVKGTFHYLCPEHGIQVGRLVILERGCGCPACAGKNQKQCYINTVYDTPTPVAIKFGIAKNSDKRIKDQNSKNLFQMEQSAVYEFKTVNACKDAEKACKRELKCGVLSKRELKDGHSETVSLLDLEKVIAIYERFGGVRVLTPTKQNEIITTQKTKEI